MNLKEQYHRFRKWQKEGRSWSTDNLGNHTCHCCGNTFTGNYCPVCGQTAGGGRITWRWVWKNIMKVWGLDSRSLPYTLWQLLWRPGYLIGEYISGKRQASYPPVNLLFLTGVFYAIIKQLLGIPPIDTESIKPSVQDALGSDALYSVNALIWLLTHPAWAMLTLSIFMIPPTWVLFHHAPRHPGHTLPEGVFIQIFLSTLILLSIILSRNVSGWFFIFIPLYMHITFQQLFGYGVWGTMWRIFQCIIVWFFTIITIACIIQVIIEGIDSTTISTIGILLVIIAIILGGGYWIGAKNSRSQHIDKQ